jgi:hypothetical protein
MFTRRLYGTTWQRWRRLWSSAAAEEARKAPPIAALDLLDFQG